MVNYYVPSTPKVLSKWIAYIGDPENPNSFQLTDLICWHCKTEERILHSIKSEYIQCLKCKRMVPTPVMEDE